MQFHADGFVELTSGDYQEITDRFREGEYLKRLLQLTQEPEREMTLSTMWPGPSGMRWGLRIPRNAGVWGKVCVPSSSW